MRIIENCGLLTLFCRWKLTILAVENPIQDTTRCMAVSPRLRYLVLVDTLYLETTIASTT